MLLGLPVKTVLSRCFHKVELDINIHLFPASKMLLGLPEKLLCLDAAEKFQAVFEKIEGENSGYLEWFGLLDLLVGCHEGFLFVSTSFIAHCFLSAHFCIK
jgi:hypothetical protein